MSETQFLCNTSFTAKWLIEKLKEKCGEFRNIVNNDEIKEVI